MQTSEGRLRRKPTETGLANDEKGENSGSNLASSKEVKKERSEETALGGLLQSLVPHRRRRLAVLTLAASLWPVFVFYCVTFISTYRPEKLEQESFDPKIQMPLFCSGLLFLFWNAAIVSENEVAVKLSSFLYSWKTFWLLQFIMTTIWTFNLIFVSAAALDSYLSKDGCSIVPGFCALHAAYDGHVWAKITYWVPLAALGCSFATLLIPLELIKYLSGFVCLSIVYKRLLRPMLLQFAVRPAEQYALQPLLRYTLEPLLWRIILPLLNYTLRLLLNGFVGIVSAPLDTYVVKTLASIFPGPGTKTEHVFIEPSLEFLVIYFISGSAFVILTSAIIFTISEEDTHLFAQKNNINLRAHLAMFYSMTLWLVWRGISAMNFTPAVRLDKLVYKSRIAWIIQALLCHFFLYTLYKLLYFAYVAFIRKEGAIGQATQRAENFCSFSIMSINVNILGIVIRGILGNLLQFGVMGTFLAIVISLVFSAKKAVQVKKRVDVAAVESRHAESEKKTWEENHRMV